MKDLVSFIGGALLGAVIGAGVVMFTTPKTGDETRRDISDRWQIALEQGRRTANEREQQLWADFNTRVKAPSDMPIDQSSPSSAQLR